MSANFTQISSITGRTQTFVPGATKQTYQFRPASLKGTLPGGDFIYAKRLRGRLFGGTITNTSGSAQNTPNWQQMASVLGNVRVYSQFLGEIVNKSLNTIPLIMNHDAYYDNGFGAHTRERPVVVGLANNGTFVPEYEFVIPFERNYLTRSIDSCFWLPFLEGGEIEIDLNPSTSLNPFGTFTLSGNWTMELVVDWYADKQPMIHTPVANRIYRVTTTGPEYLLKGVGAPNGLDGVVQGARLAILSWLAKGTSNFASQQDNGFYAPFGGGGINFGTAGLNRIDVPFRDQVSTDAVSAWVSSFLADTAAVRALNQSGGITSSDQAQWPFLRDSAAILASNGTIATAQSLITDFLDFFPLVWPDKSEGTKISDMQKVDGDLSLTATFGGTQPGNVLNLFRTEEICGFTFAKVCDLMERMGLPHVSRGGAYDFVPKYAGAKRADDTTQWGMPLKIVQASKAAA